jgi:N-acetylmuramic acid 6-phosphate etherase
MQATTIQMLAVGFAILTKDLNFSSFEDRYLTMIQNLIDTDFSLMAKLVDTEYEVYQAGGVITYIAPPSIAISVLTDTTERCPTFNLRPFEILGDKDLSLSHLCVENLKDNSQCWESVLGRQPRELDWEELKHQVCLNEIMKFNLSIENLEQRRIINPKMETFIIREGESLIRFITHKTDFGLELKQNDSLFKHLVIKLSLNIHSTLLMGKMQRYEGNMMTFVRPSNMKLIDRCLRYILELLKRVGVNASEREVLDILFDELEAGNESGRTASINLNQGVVLRVRDRVLASARN